MRQLVLTKLHAVGLRGAARLMPAELSGGMAAARGAGAGHRHGSGHPHLRRAVRGPRSDFDGRDLPPHQADERSAGHHQHRRLARRAGARRPLRTTVSCCRRARWWRPARPPSCTRASSTKCASSWAGSPMARCRFTIRRPTTSAVVRGGAVVSAAAGFGCRRSAAPHWRHDAVPGPGAGAQSFPRSRKPGTHRQADLQRRRALAGHHHVVGPVRRHGARPAGVRHAAAFRLRGFARRARGARHAQGARARV